MGTRSRALVAAATLALATPGLASPAEDFKALTDAYWAFVMRENPLYASQLGKHEYDAEVGDISLAAEDRRAAENTRVLARLAGLAADRTMNVLISGFYPFEAVREAFDDLEQRHARGKIVLGMRPVDNSFHGLGAQKTRAWHERT